MKKRSNKQQNANRDYFGDDLVRSALSEIIKMQGDARRGSSNSKTTDGIKVFEEPKIKSKDQLTDILSPGGVTPSSRFGIESENGSAVYDKEYLEYVISKSTVEIKSDLVDKLSEFKIGTIKLVVGICFSAFVCSAALLQVINTYNKNSIIDYVDNHFTNKLDKFSLEINNGFNSLKNDFESFVLREKERKSKSFMLNEKK